MRTCAKCQIKFQAKYKHKKRIAKYCSKSCWSIRKHNPRGCLACGKDVRNPKKYCGLTCRNKSYLGKKHTSETIKKMSKAKQGYVPAKLFQAGDKHPNWIADRKQINRRWWPENKIWRLAILKRDNYQCQICNIRSSKGNRITFDVDHIKPWSRFPDLRFELSNGRTLCRPCHMKTDTWLGKSRWPKKAVLDVPSDNIPS